MFSKKDAIPVIAQGYAIDDSTAKYRSRKYEKKDPFPNISSALLNSADIKAYVKQTAMIHPFYEAKLKGASYDVRIKGEVVFWKYTEKGEIEKKIFKLEKDGDSFDLEPNSIAFVTLEPYFRIPQYMALRFNLKITHVYKGLLLGTGPLVDPGFSGRLSIPLHNLTSNTYRFLFGDELITMEFTKMSQHAEWLPPNSNFYSGHTEQYTQNQITSDRDVSQYLAKALKNDRLKAVISSIPDAVKDCKEEVRTAEKAVNMAKNTSLIQSAVSVVAVCTLVISAMSMSTNAINKANERYDLIYKEYQIVQEEHKKEVAELHLIIDDLAARIDELQSIQDNTDGSVHLPADSGVAQ